MSALIKFVLATMALILFCVFFCVIWLDRLALQLIGFLALSMLLASKRGFRGWFKQVRILLPFTFTLAAVYLLFGLLKVSDPSGARAGLEFWSVYGANRIMLLLSSVLAIRVCYSYVSFDDLLALPIRISLLKYVILGKLLYEAAFSSYRQICFYQSLIPSLQVGGQSLKSRFNFRLASLLALLYYIIGEAKLKGELIDNRIRHCHQREE